LSDNDEEQVLKKKSFLSPKSKRDVDMTNGGIVGHLLRFSFPLLIGNIFQQLYNTVDTWVVGNYVSNEAFSAVGSVSPIVNMLIGTFLGLASGAGVIISQYYGAKDFKNVTRTVHTSMLITFILGIIFTALGLFITPFMLNMMDTPPDVYPQSQAYLSIYFSGIMGLMIYNMGAGILRAIGDSQRPFYYLVVSAVINTVLDLVFVICFHMGVEGVAYATIIAQGISAILVCIELFTTKSCVRVRFHSLRIDKDALIKIFKIGTPAALQMAVTAFSNVFVQSYINFFQADCMSGWTAYLKIDQFIFMPMQSLSLAATTFVGQNLGIGQVKRARKGADTALIMSMIGTAILIVPIIFLAPHLVSFFNNKAEVVEYGSLFLKYLSPFYILCCVNQIYSGALRGAGNSRAPMLIMLGSFVLFRQLYLFVMANFISNTILPIAMSYPAGWIVCSILETIYYKTADLSKTKITA